MPNFNPSNGTQQQQVCWVPFGWQNGSCDGGYIHSLFVSVCLCTSKMVINFIYGARSTKDELCPYYFV